MVIATIAHSVKELAKTETVIIITRCMMKSNSVKRLLNIAPLHRGSGMANFLDCN